MLTSEVLDLAADLIEERGWTVGGDGWSGVDAGLCIEGALSAALPRGLRWHDNVETFRACPAYRAVQSYVGGGHEELWRWNDLWDKETGDFVRTQHEVVAVLRAASAIESAREQQDAAWATYAEVVTA